MSAGTAPLDISRLTPPTQKASTPEQVKMAEIRSLSAMEGKYRGALHRIKVLENTVAELSAALELARLERTDQPQIVYRRDTEFIKAMDRIKVENEALKAKNRKLENKLARLKPCNRYVAPLAVLRIKAVA